MSQDVFIGLQFPDWNGARCCDLWCGSRMIALAIWSRCFGPGPLPVSLHLCSLPVLHKLKLSLCKAARAYYCVLQVRNGTGFWQPVLQNFQQGCFCKQRWQTGIEEQVAIIAVYTVVGASHVQQLKTEDSA